MSCRNWGIHYHERVGGLVYLDALHDGADDWTDYDSLCSELPDVMQRPPAPSPADLKSFPAYQGWRLRTEGVRIPESGWRNDFAQNPDGSVGSWKTPGYVADAIMKGGSKHDLSDIRSPVLALVAYDVPPQDQIRKNHVTDPTERNIVEAVCGTFIGMARIRIDKINRAPGGARVVELWGADHFVFLSNEADVLHEMRAFLATLPS